ncbi:type II secretion system protein [Campylobacter sp.]|uniref:type II secretion system protein n=1 Tax=Campylobacter sp. TaxID=205 RepID=UPI002A5E3168|nr:type II secretion system protein [Campylobacter sp.]MDD7703968.1 type II secretion system protein [Campylobacteraceae bacterium]MDY2634790.1 type II secretion system protein [Campylobacter sp.]
MKKGFTMIELIFVIVILGILASVAIPRLAATRTDAEVAATVANLRTLLNDVASYYAVKGEFGTTVKWKDITNVPLGDANKLAAGSGADNDGILTVGGEECIAVKVVNKKGTAPAYIVFAKKSGGDVCTQVQNAAPVRAYFDSRVEGINLEYGDNKGAIAIGSSTTIY